MLRPSDGENFHIFHTMQVRVSDGIFLSGTLFFYQKQHLNGGDQYPRV